MPHLERRSSPDESTPEQREHRRIERRRARRRRNVLRGLAIGGGLVLVTLVILSLRLNLSWMVNHKQETQRQRQSWAEAPKSMPRAGTDLVIEEASIRGAGSERRVVGVIHNKSNHAYTGVEISLFVRGRMGEGMGYVRAKLPNVGPSANAKFETDAIPAGGSRFEFYALTGNAAQ